MNADVGYSRTTDDHVVHMELLESDTVTTAVFDSFITDGIRLDWTIGTDRPGVVVILVKLETGENLKIGTFTSAASNDSSVTVTTTGVNPNFVWCMNTGAASIDTNSYPGLTMGFRSR